MYRYKFFRADDLSGRTYYTSNTKYPRLYCIQSNGNGCWAFLSCSDKGEPSHPISFPEADAFDQQVFPNV